MSCIFTNVERTVYTSTVQQANLFVRPSKCLFGSKTVNFLGHTIGEDYITVNADNLEKIRNSRRPTTKKEVRSFLGLANYYRDHVPSFVAISAPLSDLSKKGLSNTIKWGEAQEKAFVTLQEKLLSRPIFKLPDYEKPFILRTDASNRGMGAVLMQQHDEKLYIR